MKDNESINNDGGGNGIINGGSDSNESSTDEEIKLKVKFNQQKEMIKKINENKFDWELFKRFLKIIEILYASPSIPLVLFLILFGSAVAQTYVGNFTGTVLANVYGSFTTGDKSLFISSLIKGTGAIGLSALLDATIKFIVGLMAWRWRKTLCLYIQDVYFKKSLFYKILAFDDRIDNPDQRITSDIDQFTTLLATIVSQCITSPMVVIYYTYLTWTRISWYAPLIVYAYFFLGYFINKLVMSPMVGINFLQDKLEGDFRYLHQRIRNFAESIALHNLSNNKENGSSGSVELNNFKSKDQQIDEDEYSSSSSSSSSSSDEKTSIINRRNKKKQNVFSKSKIGNSASSSTSKLKSDSKLLVEEQQAKFQFETLLENKKRVIFWQYGLNTTSDLFTYLSPLINYFIISIPVFFLHTQSSLPAAQVTIQSYNCIMLASGFSQYINVSTSISDLSGYISRISTMIEVCKKVLSDQSFDTNEINNINSTTNTTNTTVQIGENNENNRSILLNDGESITLDDITYFTPKGTQLFSKISICIERGKNLLIMGPSGIGKSSLVRIINGLWPFFKGTIGKPENDKLFFLPQQPYLIFGSLEEQILYPNCKKQKRISKSTMKSLFDQLGIGYLLEREKFIKSSAQINDLTHNWLNQLSPGEQQLISIVRLFYHKPQFALLDESTSSIPQSLEERVYQIASDLNITVISVGHRVSLLKYHSTLLRFDNDKNWYFENINNNQ